MATTVTGASGTTYITGTGTSGFDSAGLIKVAVEAKMAPAYRLDDQIEILNKKSEGWTTARTDLKAVSDAAKALSSQATSSAFSARSAYLSSSTVSDPSKVLAVTVKNEASLGVYSVKVNSVATTHKVVGTEAGDKTAALGLSGTFTLSETSGTAKPITVTATMSLSDVAKAINAQSGTTGVTATLVKSSDSGYTMVLASAHTGQTITAADTSGSVLQGLGILDAGGGFVQETPATMASVTIDGVTVTSASNDIEDLVPGVSVSLYADSAGGTITLEVGQNLDGIADAVTAFVKAYNTYREVAVLNQSTDSGGAVDGAVLFGDSLLRSTNAALYAALGKTVEVDGTAYSLKSLGITYDSQNYLEVDTKTLEQMLIQHADVVQAFFEQTVTSASPDLYAATTPGTLASGDYTVNVTVDGAGNITGATINGVALDVSNKTLKGASGTIYEGLRFVYTGTESASVTVSVKAGMADNFVSALSPYTADTGLLAKKIENLGGTIDDKQSRRDRIAEQASDYEKYLTAYYARIEAAMEASKLALKQLEAVLKVNNSDD